MFIFVCVCVCVYIYIYTYVYMCVYIYIYICLSVHILMFICVSHVGVEHSGKRIYGCRSDIAKLFERIDHFGIRLGIKCKYTNAAAVAT